MAGLFLLVFGFDLVNHRLVQIVFVSGFRRISGSAGFLDTLLLFPGFLPQPFLFLLFSETALFFFFLLLFP